MLHFTRWISAAALLFAFSQTTYADEATPNAAQGQTKTKVNKKAGTTSAAKQKTNRPNRALKPMPALGEAPFPEGEQLAYQLKIFGQVAGEALLRVGTRTTQEGQPAITFAGFIRSSEYLNKFYTVNDKLTAISDLRTFLPFQSDFYIRENKSSSDYHSTISQSKKEIRSILKKKNKEQKRLFSSAPNIYDPLSAVYAVRRMNLTPGMEFELYTWDGRKERLIGVKVAKEEQIWLPQGMTNALRLDVTSTLTGGFSVKQKQFSEKPMKGTVWLSTDQNRIPLKLVAPTPALKGEAEAYFVNRTVESGNIDISAPK